MRFGDSGYTGRREPVNGKDGKGLYTLSADTKGWNGYGELRRQQKKMRPHALSYCWVGADLLLRHCVHKLVYFLVDVVLSITSNNNKKGTVSALTPA